MKKFLKKIFYVLILLLIFPVSVFLFNCYIDTFNIFHWENIRFTSAEPNKNFIKTKYVLSNPKKFNAFVLGSSRAGMIPTESLPKHLDGNELRWYNMSYSEGVPAENLDTLKTFVKNGIDVKFALVAFDCMMMYLDDEAHKKQLMRMSYSQYEKSPLNFYKNYFLSVPDKKIVSEILHYNPKDHTDTEEIFYKYGVNSTDMNVSTKFDNEKYKPFIFDYTMRDSWKSLKELYDFCASHQIKLILFTNPFYESNYRYAVAHGYLDMLRKIGEQCEFYNFSCLNKISTDKKYYFEGSHYRPIVGLTVEKMLFSTDEAEKNLIRNEVALRSGDEALFGMKVNSSNVDFFIEKLKNQANATDK